MDWTGVRNAAEGTVHICYYGISRSSTLIIWRDYLRTMQRKFGSMRRKHFGGDMDHLYLARILLQLEIARFYVVCISNSI